MGFSPAAECKKCGKDDETLALARLRQRTLVVHFMEPEEIITLSVVNFLSITKRSEVDS